MKAEWTINTLGDTCEMYQPKTISSKEMVQDGAYPVFGANGMIGRYDQYNHEEPQLLITCRGATCGSVNISEPFSWITGNAMVVRPKQVELDIRFLEYLFRGGIDISQAITGAAQPQITRTNLSPLKISYPTSIIEQQRIVAILDEAFEAIAAARANAEQNRQNARALFESVLNSVEGKPAALGDYVTIKTGKLDANAAVEGGEYPFFTCSKEIYAIDKFAFDGEAILLAGNNAVGDFNVKHYRGKFNAYQRTYVITVNNEDLLLYRFLYFQMLKSLKRFKEQSVGAGTKFLKLGMIKDLKISLPSPQEQIRLVSLLDSVLEETQRLESLYQRKIAALDELKQSLLQQAFSGQLDTTRVEVLTP
ncbi:restriction endonuclease subunit S [Aeromonas sp. QDB36]|uniref:restriction endonuclease subunit S n=1 Tax=Aeromonas sp. QDB36 TaxID=2990490 RepID=UPI0022E37CB5|nr:restriction endonuclease subunit S [Aeromonas sp. QDB36]